MNPLRLPFRQFGNHLSNFNPPPSNDKGGRTKQAVLRMCQKNVGISFDENKRVKIRIVSKFAKMLVLDKMGNIRNKILKFGNGAITKKLSTDEGKPSDYPTFLKNACYFSRVSLAKNHIAHRIGRYSCFVLFIKKWNLSRCCYESQNQR